MSVSELRHCDPIGATMVRPADVNHPPPKFQDKLIGVKLVFANSGPFIALAANGGLIDDKARP